MQETIIKYLNELSADSKKRVTDYFKEEVEEFSLLISKIIIPLQNYISLNQATGKDDPELNAYGLMTKGANTLMASFELALNGYFWEPPNLLKPTQHAQHGVTRTARGQVLFLAFKKQICKFDNFNARQWTKTEGSVKNKTLHYI